LAPGDFGWPFERVKDVCALADACGLADAASAPLWSWRPSLRPPPRVPAASSFRAPAGPGAEWEAGAGHDVTAKAPPPAMTVIPAAATISAGPRPTRDDRDRLRCRWRAGPAEALAENRDGFRCRAEELDTAGLRFRGAVMALGFHLHCRVRIAA
jgi:hypothetical protein